MDNRAFNNYDRFKNLSIRNQEYFQRYIHIPNFAKILWIKENVSSTWDQNESYRFLNLEKFLFFKCFGHMSW